VRRAWGFLLLLLLVPRPGLAWGRLAHEVIGYLAETQLTPQASSAVRRILHGRRLSDGDIANWADDLVKHLPDSGRWHYVNIPRGAGNYTDTRDCAGGNCVVAKIEEFRKEMADRSLPAGQRLDALRFVIHFVEDASQPLHCLDDHDRGGNDARVTYHHRDSNLHQVWDSTLVDEDMGRRSVRVFERQLARDLTPTLVSQLERGNLTEWINQCHSDGEIIYDNLKLRGGREQVNLPDSYGSDQRGSLELNMEKGAVRLAKVLNEAFAQEPVSSARPAHQHEKHHHRHSHRS
jgi:hypothetical protein